MADSATSFPLFNGPILGEGYLLAFIFQIYRDNQEHERELEKQKQEEHKKIVIDRLERLETDIRSLMALIQSAFRVLENFFYSENTNIEVMREFREKYLIPISDERLTILTNTFYFHDHELRETIKDVFEVAGLLPNIYNKLIKVEDKEGISNLIEELSDIPMQFADAFSRFLTRIDIVRSEALHEFEELKHFDEINVRLKGYKKTKEGDSEE